MSKTLYYGFGGGLGHITRFNAFCYTMEISPVFMTAADSVFRNKIKTLASKNLILPFNLTSDKSGFRNWFCDYLKKEKPDRLIIDSFPGGILGELSNLKELENIQVEYIARILKIEAYKKRLNGYLPNISKIWQIEELSQEHINWIKEIAPKAKLEKLDLIYPDSLPQINLELLDDFWLIVHSGSEDELKDLWEYANDTALLESVSPDYVVVGQCERPDFLPAKVKYYSIYPIGNLIKKATKVFSGAGFNMIYQMREMREKHFPMPFNRALDDQFLRCRLFNL